MKAEWDSHRFIPGELLMNDEQIKGISKSPPVIFKWPFLAWVEETRCLIKDNFPSSLVVCSLGPNM